MGNDYDEDEDFEDELDISDVIDEVIEHPRVKRTLNLFTETLDRFGQLIDQVSRKVPSAGAPPGVPPPRARSGPVPPPQRDPRRVINPYLVLGFQPGQPLTADLIKARRKKLATLYHPDQNGGDPEAMKMVNAAADMLLKKVQ